MAVFIEKWERRDGADRDALGRAALDVCRWSRAQEGVLDSRFYWADADTVAFLTTVARGARYGIGAGLPPTADGARVGFAVSDLARRVGQEAWQDAGVGEQAFRLR